jgi:hypothetical protein
MKHLSLVIGTVAALAASGASAQSINLTGIYKCVQMCRGQLPAFVTQNGPELNLVTEAGVPSRAWPDWYSPRSRIWIDAFHQSAVYSPDGMIIQFDNGTIWQRDLGPAPHRRRAGEKRQRLGPASFGSALADHCASVPRQVWPRFVRHLIVSPGTINA